jgi:5'-3' exonuclease
MQFSNEYGDIVIATDGKKSWRKDVFPFYKAHRREIRKKSEIDWNTVFNTLADIRVELEEHFPYRVIWQEDAEADDIIGALCQEYGTQVNSEGSNKILLISGDKDFIQLQRYANVSQYDPIRKRWLTHNDPEKYLIEHIISGDTGDGIPNILSADDSFVNKIRQKPITAKKKSDLYDVISNMKLDDTIKANYYRNKQLIDLKETPADIRKSILDKYDNQAGKDRSKIFNYLIKYKLKNLTEFVSDF